LLFRARKEIYIRFHDAIRKAAIHPMDEMPEQNFARQQVQCKLFASDKVVKAAQMILITGISKKDMRRMKYHISDEKRPWHKD